MTNRDCYYIHLIERIAFINIIIVIIPLTKFNWLLITKLITETINYLLITRNARKIHVSIDGQEIAMRSPSVTFMDAQNCVAQCQIKTCIRMKAWLISTNVLFSFFTAVCVQLTPSFIIIFLITSDGAIKFIHSTELLLPVIAYFIDIFILPSSMFVPVAH